MEVPSREPATTATRHRDAQYCWITMLFCDGTVSLRNFFSEYFFVSHGNILLKDARSKLKKETPKNSPSISPVIKPIRIC
jgi:hypothetical protein